MYERFGRRKFLWPVLPALVLSACENQEEPIIYQREQAKRKENNNPPEDGDIVVDGQASYLIRSNIAQLIPDLQRFLYNSKFKGRVLHPTGNILVDTFDKYLKHENIDTPYVIDQFSGQIRQAMPFGGEGIVYYPGLLTERGFPLDTITFDNDGFVEIRKDLKEKSKFELSNSNFYTYSAVGLNSYTRADTLKPVMDNILNSIAYMSILERQQPYVQFTVIAHSFGGVLALEAVRRSMGSVNNLILIDVPFEGFDADKFGEEFTAKGKGLVVIRSDDDSITKNSRDIKGSRLVVLKGSGHGSALKNRAVRGIICDTVGMNLAA